MCTYESKFSTRKHALVANVAVLAANKPGATDLLEGGDDSRCWLWSIFVQAEGRESLQDPSSGGLSIKKGQNQHE